MDKKIYDLIVIGGGPAGLTAGIYAGRAMLDVLVIEKDRAGGQINLTSEVVNYPGIIETSGEKFGEELKKQALGFGVNFLNDEVIDMDLTKEIKTIKQKENEKRGKLYIFTGSNKIYYFNSAFSKSSSINPSAFTPPSAVYQTAGCSK